MPRSADLPTAPLTSYQRELVARPEHLALAYRLADGYAARHRRPVDDYRAAALYGLVRAARRYRPARGAFRPFAAVHIRWSILDDLREAVGGGIRGPRGRRPACADRGDDFLEAIPADEGPVGWAFDSEDGVRAWCRRLPPKMGTALGAYLLRADRATVAAVGAELGVCEGHAARLIGNAVNLLAADIRVP